MSIGTLRKMPAETSLDDTRNRLRQHFTTSTSEHGNRWSQLWDKGDFLPFDKGAPNPALRDTLKNRTDLLGTSLRDVQDLEGQRNRKRALVPGCGRGYDVLLLASFGYDAYGLEISETAVKRCEEEKAKNGINHNAQDETVGVGTIKFVQGDFFKDEWLKILDMEGESKFDLVYDYTFLSALPPEMRPAWSLRMSQLLAQNPDGNLICVEFPTYKDPSRGGPPWALPSEVYLEHLSHPGEELAYDEKGHIRQDVLRRASPGGLERVAHWQPERTHEIGKGTDWVSVWRHKQHGGTFSGGRPC